MTHFHSVLVVCHPLSCIFVPHLQTPRGHQPNARSNQIFNWKRNSVRGVVSNKSSLNTILFVYWYFIRIIFYRKMIKIQADLNNIKILNLRRKLSFNVDNNRELTKLKVKQLAVDQYQSVILYPMIELKSLQLSEQQLYPMDYLYNWHRYENIPLRTLTLP